MEYLSCSFTLRPAFLPSPPPLLSACRRSPLFLPLGTLAIDSLTQPLQARGPATRDIGR